MTTAPWLIIVTGWTGSGKSSISDELAEEFGATVASYDWLMSGLRELPEVWGNFESAVELRQAVGWNLLSRVAEQQLRLGSSCILDLVAGEEPRRRWYDMAHRYDADFAVIECICSDAGIHRSRVDGRVRGIPGWYELDWSEVERGRSLYQPLDEPKLVLDAIDPLAANVAAAKDWLAATRRS
ncbi:MAG: AAA family ATPase [Actinomycetota bacterium]